MPIHGKGGNHTAKPPPSHVQVVLTGGTLRSDLDTAVKHISPMLRQFHLALPEREPNTA